jgi:hypothetical protein
MTKVFGSIKAVGNRRRQHSNGLCLEINSGVSEVEMRNIMRGLLCTVGFHRYEFLGTDRKDQIFCCSNCGARKVKIYTLRINRLL